MKILVVGGGSGGHITPAVSVVREVLERKPRTRVEFWTDKKYYKNVVKITTEIGVGWGGEDKASTENKPYIRVVHGQMTYREHFALLPDIDLYNYCLLAHLWHAGVVECLCQTYTI